MLGSSNRSLSKDSPNWVDFLPAQHLESNALSSTSNLEKALMLDDNVLRFLSEMELDSAKEEMKSDAVISSNQALFSSLDEAYRSGGHAPGLADTSPHHFHSTPNTNNSQSTPPVQMNMSASQCNSAIPLSFSSNGCASAWVFPPRSSLKHSQEQPQQKAPAGVVPSYLPPQQQQNNHNNRTVSSLSPPAYGVATQSSLGFQQQPQQPQQPQQQQQGPFCFSLGEAFNPAQLQNTAKSQMTLPAENATSKSESTNMPAFLMNGLWPRQPQLQSPQQQSVNSGAFLTPQQLQLLNMLKQSPSAAGIVSSNNTSSASSAQPSFPAASMSFSLSPNPMGSTQSIAETQCIISRLQEQLRQLRQQEKLQQEKLQREQQSFQSMYPLTLLSEQQRQSLSCSRDSNDSSNRNTFTPVLTPATALGLPPPNGDAHLDVPIPPWLEANKPVDRPKTGKTAGWVRKGSKWIPIYTEG